MVAKTDTAVQQARDTGLAAVLIVLLFTHFAEWPQLILAAIALLILVMAWPTAFRPLAGFWFGFSEFLGNIMSKVILTSIFALVATPVGLVRRLAGADSMKQKEWKQGNGSVFVNRDCAFSAKDLEQPF